MRIQIEIETPLVLVKHCSENQVGALHLFEVWEVPEDAQDLLDKASVASTFVASFEGGFDMARLECRTFLDQEYGEARILWVKKEDGIYAVGREESKPLLFGLIK